MEEKQRRQIPAGIFMLLFLLLEAVLFALFLLGKINEFAIVAAAFCYVAVRFAFTKRQDPCFRNRLFLLLAMAFTLTSDVFLVLLHDYQTLAVCTFFAAQIFHALQITRSKKQTIVSFSLRVGVSLVALPILGVAGCFTPLYAAVAFYGPQLIGNLVEHFIGVFRHVKRQERVRSALLAVAFALFLACDVCVGLSEIGVPEVGFYIWLFYAPSQALIAIL